MLATTQHKQSVPKVNTSKPTSNYWSASEI